MSLSGGKFTIVAGSTGSVGRLIVQTCLSDPRIEKVAAIVRTTVPKEKAETLWGSANTSKLTQIQVDFTSLDTNNEALRTEFQGADAFITGLGLYSGRVTEAEMDMVEGKYNSLLATIAHESGAKRGAYLSGQGVKQPTLEGRAFAMFGRAKGRAEESLVNIFSDPSGEGHVSARPGAIFDRPGAPVYGFFDSMLTCWPFSALKDTRFGISAYDIAKGMVQGALFDTENGNIIWENEQIKEAARRYDTNFEGKE